jgi:hypothetical protein
MGNVIKFIIFAFLSFQFVGNCGFGFVENVFAEEAASDNKKSSGAWQKPALLSKAVNSSNRSIIKWPAAAINDSGDGIAVGVQPDKEKLPRVQMSEYRDGKWLEPVFVSLPTGGAKNPVVAIAANGDVVLAWEQKTIDRNHYIYMAERRNGSWKLPKSDAEHISLVNKYAWEQDVAINGKGETIIVWSQESESGVHAIYKSEYRNGAWKHPQDINDYISPQQGSDALRPQVAMNNSGAALIAWEQPGSNDNSLIFMSELRENKWSHPGDLNDHISPKSSSRKDSAHRPLVGMDEKGNAAISWQQRHGSKQSIFLSEYRGGKWRHPKSPGKTISPSEAKSPSIHDLQMGGNGNTIILWASYEMRRDALYKSEFIQGKWNHPTKDDPFVASPSEWEFKVLGKSSVSDGDRAIIAWLQRGKNNDSRVYFVEYENGKWHLPGQILNSENSQASGLALSSAPKGNSVIVWTETDGKNEQIFSKVFRVKD